MKMFSTALLLVLLSACNASEGNLSTDALIPLLDPHMPTGNGSQVIREENPVPVAELDPNTPPSPVNPVPAAMKEMLERDCGKRPKLERQTYQTTIADELTSIDGIPIFNKDVTIDDLAKFFDGLRAGKKWWPAIEAAFRGRRYGEVFSDEFFAEYISGVNSVTLIGAMAAGVKFTPVVDPVVQEATDEALGLKEDESGQVKVEYTDVLIEEDQGDVLPADSIGLRAVNISGLLHVEPATDGEVSWAARKWVFAERLRGGRKSSKEMRLHSLALDGWDRVEVDHPSNNHGSVPRTHYQVCLVVKAPPTLLHSLQNDTGKTESWDHTGPLIIGNNTGDITVRKTGIGDLWLSNSNGKIEVVQQGTGDLFAQNDNGTISVEAGPQSGVRLLNSVGSTTYTLRGGGVSLQRDSSIISDAGSIKVLPDPTVGFLLDASVDIAASSGSIFLSADLPQPEKSGLTAEKINTPIQGGGAHLTLHTQEAPITVTHP